MSKFIRANIATIVDSGTTTASTANKLTESGQDFLTTVSVGDIVWNTTDGTTATVTAVDSNTVLSLSANVVPTSKAYTIYSKNGHTDQIISVNGAILVQQDSTTTVTVAYGSGSTGTDILTITHTPIASGAVTMRNAVQNQLIASQEPGSRPNVVFDLVMPSVATVVTGIAIA
jgi:hypothetical protein